MAPALTRLRSSVLADRRSRRSPMRSRASAVGYRPRPPSCGRDARSPAGGLQVREHRRASRTAAKAPPWVASSSVKMRGTISKAVNGSLAIAASTSARRSPATSSRLPSMWACTSVNVRPWPARHRRAPSAFHDIQRAQEFADRVGRVAEVEEQGDAPEQVIAGDQEASLGLEQAHVRGAWPGVSYTVPRAQVGLDDDPGQELAIGLDHAGDARFVVLALCAKRRSGSSGTPHWRATSRRRSRSPRGPAAPTRHVLVFGVHPQLAAGPLARSRRPGRSGRSGRGCRRPGARPRRASPHMPSARSSCAIEPVRRRALVVARVEQHDAVAGLDRPGVAVRHAGPGQGQAQAIDAGQHALAPSQLAFAGRARSPALRLLRDSRLSTTRPRLCGSR